MHSCNNIITIVLFSLVSLLLYHHHGVLVNAIPCTHPVYCTGQLLETVQLAQVFNDSKTFVDMPLRQSPELVLSSFQQLLANTSNEGGPNKQQLTDFINTYFYPAGYEVQAATPVDWIPHPRFLSHIKDPQLKMFGEAVHKMWNDLYRVFNHTGLCQDCYTSVQVENPFIIAGSRFREFYYWDSYWMVIGLLVSEMTATVRGMIANDLALIQLYGFVPNGGRIYYSDRSQPPLLTQMVERYFDATNDVSILEQGLPTLDAEYQFWMTQRSVNVKGFKLNLYNATTPSPRPESFYEDYTMAQSLPVGADQTFFYSSIASAAESGMDFSTRWMKPGSMDLETIETIEIVPVDLNSILYRNELTLARFHLALGNSPMHAYYKNQASQRAKAINSVFWDPVNLQWFDYHLDTNQLQTEYYITNFHPLWAKVYQEDPITFNSTVLSNILNKARPIFMNFVGGVPTSLINSGQQWDFPNAWAPLEYFLVEGLLATELVDGKMMAFDMVERWITTNYCGWQETLQSNGGVLFEKYNVTDIGLPGGGGEYAVQTGFGWSNGFALNLLSKYGNTITLRSC
ncbi:Trehalase precursor [Cavenderia fasciculata]|uniref:Trehalase n=1 Tax=Cavenderia fasciculata TaxID=261658 RepID=F4Q535_CACFS|nr:Trehalase precursor [Cavenderia fasciculata]EGG17928.1 Trehalase precursor [Cavenderia fasciculata]|eukprot:XP_004356412.1 Trehalase precursor [Cavenderia fasciculata]